MGRVSFSCMLVLFVSLGLGLFTPTFAATEQVPYATVAVVQMPAWLERDGQRQPLAIGMEVKNGDRIRTGVDARTYLKLAEGSTVKLGENASLGFFSRSLKPVSNFKGAFDVLAGTFRFTTGTLQRVRSQRDVTLRVGAASVGIRGGDIWGKADAERDLILLIEGRVELRQDGQLQEISEPLTTFSVARNTGALEVVSADSEQVRQWALETEVLPGAGATQAGGKWRVLLVRASSQKEALEVYDAARLAGYATKVTVLPAGNGNAEKDGQWNYDVVVLNLVSQQEAAALADKISRQLGFAALVEK